MNRKNNQKSIYKYERNRARVKRWGEKKTEEKYNIERKRIYIKACRKFIQKSVFLDDKTNSFHILNNL